MPNTPPAPHVPRCPNCGAIGTAKQETTIKGPVADVLWKCPTCGYQWPAKSWAA